MKLVKTHGNGELVKGLRKPKKANEPRMPKRKTKGTQEPITRKTNGHIKPLGERINGRPKETQQD